MKKFNSKDLQGKIAVLGLLILLILAVPAVVFFRVHSPKQKYIQPKSSEEVRVDFQGEIPTLKLVLHNTAGRQILVSGAQGVLSAGENLLIDSAGCLPPFNGLMFTDIKDGRLTVMCTISAGMQPVMLGPGAAGTAFADIKLRVTGNSGSAARLKFESVRVTEAGVNGKAQDLSKAGKDFRLQTN